MTTNPPVSSAMSSPPPSYMSAFKFSHQPRNFTPDIYSDSRSQFDCSPPLNAFTMNREQQLGFNPFDMIYACVDGDYRQSPLNVPTHPPPPSHHGMHGGGDNGMAEPKFHMKTPSEIFASPPSTPSLPYSPSPVKQLVLDVDDNVPYVSKETFKGLILASIDNIIVNALQDATQEATQLLKTIRDRKTDESEFEYHREVELMLITPVAKKLADWTTSLAFDEEFRAQLFANFKNNGFDFDKQYVGTFASYVLMDNIKKILEFVTASITKRWTVIVNPIISSELERRYRGRKLPNHFDPTVMNTSSEIRNLTNSRVPAHGGPPTPVPPTSPILQYNELINQLAFYTRDVLQPLLVAYQKPQVFNNFLQLCNLINHFLTPSGDEELSKTFKFVEKALTQFVSGFADAPGLTHQDKSHYCSAFARFLEVLRNYIPCDMIREISTNVIIETAKGTKFNKEALLILIRSNFIDCKILDSFLSHYAALNDANIGNFARKLQKAYGRANIDQFVQTFPSVHHLLITMFREY